MRIRAASETLLFCGMPRRCCRDTPIPSSGEGVPNCRSALALRRAIGQSGAMSLDADAEVWQLPIVGFEVTDIWFSFQLYVTAYGPGGDARIGKAAPRTSDAAGEPSDVVVPDWCQDALTRGVREPTARHHAFQRRRSAPMQRSRWHASNVPEQTASSTPSPTRSAESFTKWLGIELRARRRADFGRPLYHRGAKRALRHECWGRVVNGPGLYVPARPGASPLLRRRERETLVIGHGSDGATALFDMPGFVVGAHVLEHGEWWLLVETTADRVAARRVGCGRSVTAARRCGWCGRSASGVAPTRIARRQRGANSTIRARGRR